MKELLISLALVTILSCSQDDSKSNIDVNDFGTGNRIELSGASIVRSQVVDINSDGHPDYIITLEKHDKNGTSYLEDAFYISIEKVTSYLQVVNPFEPVVIVDNSMELRKVDNILIWHLVRYYDANQLIDEVHSNSVYKAFLSKTDEFETVQPLGTEYIPVALIKDGVTFYGWIEVELEPFAIVIKKIAFCKTGNEKINVGSI